MERSYYVYIMASNSGTLYIGVTGNLRRRVEEHRLGLVEGFTRQYNCKKLIYYERTDLCVCCYPSGKTAKKVESNQKRDTYKNIESFMERSLGGSYQVNRLESIISVDKGFLHSTPSSRFGRNDSLKKGNLLIHSFQSFLSEGHNQLGMTK